MTVVAGTEEEPAFARHRGAAAAGAFAWLLVLALRLASAPLDWWRWRDDAVITLSHAHGWVVDGAISVSTTGARVDGFSTPLQFGLAAISYRLGLMQYGTFLDVQVVVALLLCGYFIALIAQDDGGGRRWWTSVAVPAVTAVFVAAPWATIGWFGSGMEESLAAAAMLATAAGLARLDRREGRVGGAVFAGIALAALGLARVEFAILMLPVVALAVGVAFRRSRVGAAVVAAIPLATWSAVHLARRWYFGSFAPNTVLAEEKSPGAVVRSWVPATAVLVLSVAVLGGLAFGAWTLWRRRASVQPPSRLPDLRRPQLWAVALGIAVAGLFVMRVAIDRSAVRTPQTWEAVRDSLSTLGLVGFLVLVLAGLLLRRSALGAVHAGLALLAVLPLVQLAIAGGARLDPVRVASLSVPPLALLIVLLYAASIRDRRSNAVERWDGVLLGAGALLIVCAGAWFVTHRSFTDTRDLCCEISPLDEIIAARAQQQQDRTALPSVIVANPDLGKLSDRREFEIVDLGLLGDPLLTRLTREAPQLRDRYLLEIAAPDLVELHPGFSCQYATWTTSELFRVRYRQLEATPFQDDVDPTCPEPIQFHIYARSLDDPSYRAEVDLSRQLAQRPADAPQIVRNAIELCVQDQGDALRCEHVRRAVTRNRRALRAIDQWEPTILAFEASPAARLDHTLLAADATAAWHNVAYAALLELDTTGQLKH